MRKSVALALALGTLAACAPPRAPADARTEAEARGDSARPAAGPAQAGARAAGAQAREQAPLYVDVRTPEEFAAGHLTGAINIPYDQMAQRWTELKAYTGRPVVLYCRSGHRAGIALEVLKQKGVEATNGGGLEQLRRQGIQ